MSHPIYEIPIVNTNGLRPRNRRSAEETAEQPGFLADPAPAPHALAAPEVGERALVTGWAPLSTPADAPTLRIPSFDSIALGVSQAAGSFEAPVVPERAVNTDEPAAYVPPAYDSAPPVHAAYEPTPHEVELYDPIALEAVATVSAFESPPFEPIWHDSAAYNVPPTSALVTMEDPVPTAVMPEVEIGPILVPDTADRDLIAALSEVLRLSASDLHLTSNAPPMLRVDGGLRAVEGSVTWSAARVHEALYSLLTEQQKKVFELDLELDFAFTVTANARFRVNFYQQRGNIGAAFRIIPTAIMDLTELGVPATVAEFSKLARGLVLVTGPTGSGKSTTLAALVDLVNRTRADHIMTVEDPIEFMHSNHKSLVNQREVGNDTHSFAAALKHVLRQDPDVILIGELRDLETVSVALTAAETGHLVFATLHTQDAAQTIDRIIDVFPPHQQGQVRAQLAATLQGVVCQTLIKKATGNGRVVATEVLVATPAIKNLIREGKTYQISSSMQAGREHGMFTMDQHLAELVNSGQIAVRAAYEKCHDEETLKRLISRQETQADGGMTVGIDFGDRFSGRD